MNLSETINLLNSKTSNLVKHKVNTQDAQDRKISNEDDVSPATTDTNDSVKEQFDTFLTLLTAQIKNQDPLAPVDSTQFVDQLATFSGLELQAKANQSLDRITQLLARQIALTNPIQSSERINTTKV